jgi:tetratricopeptide (TPR) repeat protein
MNEFLANWTLHRCQHAVEKSPDDAKRWSKLYGAYADHDKTAEFIGYCREFLQNRPDSQQAWKFLRMASEGQAVEADSLEFVRNLVRQHPDCERAWIQLDVESDKLESPAEWIGLCRDIVSRHPNNMYAWSRLMRELKSEAKHADLVSACLQAIKLKPDAQTWLNLADAYAAQSKFDEAISAYEKALVLKPNFLVALNGLGCVLHTLGRYEEAVGIYLKAAELNKGDATPWVWLALAYMQLGQRQRAQDAILKVKKPLPMVAEMLNAELESMPADSRGSEISNARITIDRLALQLTQPASA